jgi:NCAIR mutase (PurE)-related protein
MLGERELLAWIRQIQRGRRSPRAALEALRRLPFDNLGFARLDTHRRLRRGLPEVVLAEGKRPAQLVRIVRGLIRTGELALVTRLDPAVFTELRAHLPRLRYDPAARLAYVVPPGARRPRGGLALVLTGGTSDVPVAEEAALTLTLLGSRAARLYDVGVAGVHRLLAHWRLLQRARVTVVVAGMDGALPSVVAGLIRCPVIAVPTSVGYGANFQGIGPLLTMLNSCAPGVAVVNIDNGFGAGYLAHVINQPPRT